MNVHRIIFWVCVAGLGVTVTVASAYDISIPRIIAALAPPAPPVSPSGCRAPSVEGDLAIITVTVRAGELVAECQYATTRTPKSRGERSQMSLKLRFEPHPWRQSTLPREPAADAPADVPLATTQFPLDADLTALLEKDDTLLATIQEQCRARGLYIVHNGREIKITPVIEPGWRVIVENDLDRARQEAA